MQRALLSSSRGWMRWPGRGGGRGLRTLLFLMSVILVLKGGPVVGPTLSLLGQYLPGWAWPTAPGGTWGLDVRPRPQRGHAGYVALLRWRARRAYLRKLLDEI